MKYSAKSIEAVRAFTEKELSLQPCALLFAAINTLLLSGYPTQISRAER